MSNDKTPDHTERYEWLGNANEWKSCTHEEAIKLSNAKYEVREIRPFAHCTCPSGDGSLRHPCPSHPATLATVKHGGCVQLGDGLPPLPEAWYRPNSPNAPIGQILFSEEQMRDYARTALSAQPSPGGQGDAQTIEKLRAMMDHSLGGPGFVVYGTAQSIAEVERRLAPSLAARQPDTDEQYADEQALIDHLDELMDDGGQGGEKWPPAQAAIAGIIAARQPVGEPVAKSVGIDAIVQLLVDDAEECAKGWVERGDAYASGKSAGLLAAADYFRKIATSQRWSEFLSSPAQAVDLGQFREAVAYAARSADFATHVEIGSKLRELLALIDSHSAGGQP